MDNNLTHEQINNIKEELERLDIPFDNSVLKSVNPKEYISSIFSHISIPESISALTIKKKYNFV